MMFLRLLLASLVFFVAPVAMADAQTTRTPCGPDGEAIVAMLEKDWGESVKAMALNSRGHLVRWLVNEETGTWSMVVTMPARSGEAAPGCLTADGVGFYLIPAVVGDPS